MGYGGENLLPIDFIGVEIFFFILLSYKYGHDEEK